MKCSNDENDKLLEDMKAQIQSGHERERVLREALQELNDIIQGHLDGEDIVIDSFTLQPARKALKSSHPDENAKEEK